MQKTEGDRILIMVTGGLLPVLKKTGPVGLLWTSGHGGGLPDPLSLLEDDGNPPDVGDDPGLDRGPDSLLWYGDQRLSSLAPSGLLIRAAFGAGTAQRRGLSRSEERR